MFLPTPDKLTFPQMSIFETRKYSLGMTRHLSRNDNELIAFPGESGS